MTLEAAAVRTEAGRRWWRDRVVGAADSAHYDLDRLATLPGREDVPLPDRTLWTAAWPVLVAAAGRGA